MESGFTLRPGDVVTYELEDYVVESQTTYSSPRLSWTEWVLSAGDAHSRVMLSLIGSQLRAGRPCFAEGSPGDQMVRCEGKLLDLKVAGRADASMVFDTGATRFDRAEFWHYEDKEGRLIAIRRGHLGEWALDLKPLDPAVLDVYNA